MDRCEVRVRIGLQEDGLWRAEVPELRGCFVDAPTVAQALGELQDVAAMIIDLYAEEGWAHPTSSA